MNFLKGAKKKGCLKDEREREVNVYYSSTCLDAFLLSTKNRKPYYISVYFAHFTHSLIHSLVAFNKVLELSVGK